MRSELASIEAVLRAKISLGFDAEAIDVERIRGRPTNRAAFEWYREVRYRDEVVAKVFWEHLGDGSDLSANQFSFTLIVLVRKDVSAAYQREAGTPTRVYV
jgi:hypothetical protein